MGASVFPQGVYARQPLSFEERVKAQEAIEHVRYDERTWPKENDGAKPPFEQAVPKGIVESKVGKYLKESALLEEFWGRPITGEQLQQEVDRMARRTHRPDALRRLFAALGNEPSLIAECLARPLLADRNARTWYATDERVHGEQKARIAVELRRCSQSQDLKDLSGHYSETEWVRDGDASADGKEGERDPGHNALSLSEWQAHVESLARQFASPRLPAAPIYAGKQKLKPGMVSGLQEDEESFFVVALLEVAEGRFKTACVRWEKKPFENWLAESNPARIGQETSSFPGFILPALTGINCTDNTWSQTGCPLDARNQHTAIWTGTEMIVWGGSCVGGYFRDGCRYNPATDTWTPTSIIGAPAGRLGHSAVWTGTEMIVWGGYDGTRQIGSGGRYNPATDTWASTSPVNTLINARWLHTAVWTGSRMIIWGGGDGTPTFSAQGVSYDPGADAWNAISTTNAPAGRYQHTAVWANGVMVIWGGTSNTGSGCCLYNTGGRYDPVADSWTATATTGAPDPRALHAAIWTGSVMIVWGGDAWTGSAQYFKTGGLYDPVADTWAPMSIVGAPDGRITFSAVWLQDRMVVWGGYNASGYLGTGGCYNPGDDTWVSVSSINAPSNRQSHSAVAAGNEMVVFGGYDGSNSLKTGGRYNLHSDSWVPTAVADVPSRRSYPGVVWTGAEMIVWGGADGTSRFNTGALYEPATDAWIPTSIVNAPSARRPAFAFWTGASLLTWGEMMNGSVTSGGLYNPAADTWSPMSNTGAPSQRSYPTALWTGREMLVWGGTDYSTSASLNTGARYDPCTDAWTATSTAGAPSPRSAYASIWTGTEMIVWGGRAGAESLDTGGRYNPRSDAWASMSTTGAPAARNSHGAVWTKTEMIVWGGRDASGAYLATGGRYNPITDIWSSCSTAAAPAPRVYPPRLLWTGSEMILWGDSAASGGLPLGTGARYRPSTDQWYPISITGAPQARSNHAEVWTGSELLVWGGQKAGPQYDSYLSDGGRYSPSLDAWTPTPSFRAPAGRSGQSVIWTGTEIIVWGGLWYMGGSQWEYFNNGGRLCALGGAAPGTVPDGAAKPGTPLTVSRLPGHVCLSWSPPAGTCSANDYAIYRGTLPLEGYNHASLLCSTGGATAVVVPEGPGSYYYIVVALDGGKEGSYGVDSVGAQRPAAPSPCLPQDIGTCD
jgi:N-acetylneuraminic acid mutarotase